MDIITHAVAGAAIGAVLGHPVVGAMAAVVPDSALWLAPRPALPPALYRAAHGGLAPLFVSAICLPIFGPQIAIVVLLAWISHIILDIPTHGPDWSPRLFWPDERVVFDKFEEWEWFNHSWWFGFFITIVWVLLCLLLFLMLQLHL